MTSPHTLIPDDLMHQLSQRVAQELGLEYPPTRWKDLMRGIRAAMPALECQDEIECVRRLGATPFTSARRDVLAAHLTVGETYFWREHATLAALEQHVFPHIIEQRRLTTRHLNIWSAGCCSGEEPYTIAIILHRLLPDIAHWRINLHATDLNQNFLNKARTGIYGPWSFRGTPAEIQDTYFDQNAAGLFELKPHIRRMVQFSHGNLAQETWPTLPVAGQGFDVVLCRNVLIYLGADLVQRIIGRFTLALQEGGWLALSATEASLVQSVQLKASTFPGATLFQKVPVSHTPPPVAAATVNRIFSGKQPVTGQYQRREGKRDERAHTKLRTLASQYRAAPRPAVAEAVELAPGLEDARKSYQRACDYANLGQLAQALEWCEKALARDRLAAPVYFLRASIQQELGEMEASRQALQQAIYLDSQFVMAHFALGNLMVQRQNPAQARLHFANVLHLLRNLDPDSILPNSDGVSASQLTDLVTSIMKGLA